MSTDGKQRKQYYCPKCGAPFHFQVHRSWLVKRLHFLFPVKKYFCARCKKAKYVFVNK